MSRLHRNRKKMALKREHAEQCLRNYTHAVNKEFAYIIEWKKYIEWKKHIGNEYNNMTEDEIIKSFTEFRKNYISDKNE